MRSAVIKKTFWAIGLFCLLFTVDTYGAGRTKLNDNDMQVFFESLQSQLSGVKNFEVGFIQKRTIPFFTNPLVTDGICYFKNPDQIRWEMKGDFPSIMIHTDKGGAKFEVMGKKLKKTSLGKTDVISLILKEIAQWLKGDFQSAKSYYSIAAFKSGKVTIVQLIPKNKQVQEFIQNIELEFITGTPFVNIVRIKEGAGSETLIDFKQPLVDTVLKSYVFDLADPLP